MPVIKGGPRRRVVHPPPHRNMIHDTAPEPIPALVEGSSTPASVAKSSEPPSIAPPGSAKKRKKPKKKLTPQEKRKRYLKWAMWIIIIIAVIIFWGWLKLQFITILQSNPTLWAIYQGIAAEIEARSLLGLFYAASFGALFFVALPVELIFLYYLGLNYYFVQILVITLIGNLLGITFDYFVGWLIGPKVLLWFMKKETYHKFQGKLAKAGPFLIIGGNIIPFPIEPFTVFLGAVRYGYLRLMIYTVIGKTIKFFLLWLGYKYFVRYVSPYIATVDTTWLLNVIKSGFGG